MIISKSKGVGQGRWSVLASLIIILMLALTACGDNSLISLNTTHNHADLPLDRALILSNRDGWPDLYTVDISGKITGRLTESPAAEYGAVWSPDGRKIAFTELNGDQAAGDYTKGEQVVVVDADGQNRRVVTNNGFNPVWSSDSQKLLFTRLNQTPSAGPSLQREAAAPATPQNSTPPIFTPNQATPAGTNGGATGAASLYIVGDSGQPVLLTQNAVAGVWSADGKRVAYIGGSNAIDQKRTLNLINVDGTNRISLTNQAKLGDLDILYVAWSPDGTSLAFTAADSQKDLASLYKLSPESSSARKLVDYAESARQVTSLIWAYADYYNPASKLHLGPVWSPNSRSLAFTDGSARLTVVDATNGNVRYFPVGAATLGQDKDSVLNVSWLADSRRLLYDRANAGQNSLLNEASSYIYDYFNETLETLDTVNKNTLTLTNSPGATLIPSCCGMDWLGAGDPNATATAGAKPSATPSGAPAQEGNLVYVSGIGQRQLIVNNLKTGSQTVISSGAFKQIDFTLAPTGGKLLYIEVGEGFNSTLYLASLDGKQKQKLSQGGGNPDDLSYVANWSPDGKHIAFQALSNDPNLKAGIYGLDVDDNGNPVGQPRMLTKQNASAFTWSPDSHYIAFKVDADQYELWVVPIDGSQPEQQLAAVGRFDNRYSSLGRGLVWSPDGKYIAMSGASNMTMGDLWQVWLVTPQAKIVQVSSYYINRLIGFSPDSSRLIATIASTGQSSSIQAYIMPTGTTPTRGWRSYDQGYGPLIAADSQSLAYYDSGQNDSITGQPNNAGRSRVVIATLGAGTIHPVNLDYTPYYAFKSRFYTWDTTGKNLAYYENNTIYLTNAQGTQTKQVLARAFVVDRLAWTK